MNTDRDYISSFLLIGEEIKRKEVLFETVLTYCFVVLHYRGMFYYS